MPSTTCLCSKDNVDAIALAAPDLDFLYLVDTRPPVEGDVGWIFCSKPYHTGQPNHGRETCLSRECVALKNMGNLIHRPKEFLHRESSIQVLTLLPRLCNPSVARAFKEKSKASMQKFAQEPTPISLSPISLDPQNGFHYLEEDSSSFMSWINLYCAYLCIETAHKGDAYFVSVWLYDVFVELPLFIFVPEGGVVHRGIWACRETAEEKDGVAAWWHN